MLMGGLHRLVVANDQQASESLFAGGPLRDDGLRVDALFGTCRFVLGSGPLFSFGT